MSDGHIRCSWCSDDELYVAYHDLEWGVPKRDENTLFELLSLEGAQAGLSWITVLRRREGYRHAFKNFDPDKVARFDDARVNAIMADSGVIRHRGKIESVVTNARAVLDIQREQGSFSDYLWALGKAENDGQNSAAAMSKRLRKDGFKFVGPTICYALMQSGGMVNDHAHACFRFNEIETLRNG
ncbi:MAG: DNA-3-methyladenine glycosylase I [Acidimicrobiales bacterium]